MPLTATHLPTTINHAGSWLTRHVCSSLTTSLWVKALVQGLAGGWPEVASRLPSPCFLSWDGDSMPVVAASSQPW